MYIQLIRDRRTRTEGARAAAKFYHGATNFVIGEWEFLNPFCNFFNPIEKLN